MELHCDITTRQSSEDVLPGRAEVKDMQVRREGKKDEASLEEEERSFLSYYFGPVSSEETTAAAAGWSPSR